MGGDPISLWRDGLKTAVNQAGGISVVAGATTRSGFDVQLRRWISPQGPVPDLRSLITLSELLGEHFTLEDQIGILVSRGSGNRRNGAPEPLRSRQLLLTRLWYAVNDAVQSRPVIGDLVRSVLDPADRRHPADRRQRMEIGRWRARQFDIPTGVMYRHIAFRAVEFQRGPGAPGSTPDGGTRRAKLTPPWTPSDFERAGADLDDLIQNAPPWIQQIFTSATPVSDTWQHPQHPDFHLNREVAYDRLELRWRLRGLAPLVPLTWYGELGALHRGLLYNSHTDRPRHIAVVSAYHEQFPDPAMRIRPDWLARNGFSRVTLVGPSSALTGQIGAVISDAWGWNYADARELVAELTGSRPTYGTSDRQRHFEQAYRQLAQPHYAESANVTAIHDLDTIAADGTLRQAVAELLATTGCYTVLLQPTAESALLWRERQANLLPKGTPVSQVNDPACTSAAMAAATRTLENQDPGRASWTCLRWQTSIPWWPASLPEGSIPPFWDNRIGDLLMRAGYALATRLAEGKLPGSRVKKPPFIDSSLLWDFVTELRKDNQASRIFTDLGPQSRSVRRPQS